MFPFDASESDVLANPEPYVDSVFSCLESEFLVMPRGAGFVEFETFDLAYERLKSVTGGFSHLDPDTLVGTISQNPIALIVLRAMLGFTPPEWAYVASKKCSIEISQGYVRSLDRKARILQDKPLNLSGVSEARLKALIETACDLLKSKAPIVENSQIHRLDKADTRLGLESMSHMASIGVPYSMLLYERFLGRPFAGHRDSVSDIVGDVLESMIEHHLAEAGITYRKTKRAERIQGFEQTPDFIVPNEFNPKVVIEAKITEDDGTARDKVTRIQHLREMSDSGLAHGEQKYEVIACIGGRGFGQRREDMKKLIIATRGKLYTAKTLPRMIDSSSLKVFRSK